MEVSSSTKRKRGGEVDLLPEFVVRSPSIGGALEFGFHNWRLRFGIGIGIGHWAFGFGNWLWHWLWL